MYMYREIKVTYGLPCTYINQYEIMTCYYFLQPLNQSLTLYLLEQFNCEECGHTSLCLDTKCSKLNHVNHICHTLANQLSNCSACMRAVHKLLRQRKLKGTCKRYKLDFT